MIITHSLLKINATTGTLSATSFNSLSDANTKTDINTIENSIEKIKILRVVSYKHTDVKSERQYIGLIAQEAEKIVPEIVFTNDVGL